MQVHKAGVVATNFWDDLIRNHEEGDLFWNGQLYKLQVSGTRASRDWFYALKYMPPFQVT
ncbi:hypothetical protein FUA25_07590 [Chryseobacterium sp.]|nr:hypothetical protein FUA25_07590 [Chryseobacterium sp.]